MLMKEHDFRLFLIASPFHDFDRTAARRAERNGPRIHAALRQIRAKLLSAVETGAFARCSVAFDEQGRLQSRVSLQAIDVLRVDPTQNAAILQQREHEVAGRGMVLLIRVEHLASKDPERRAELVEVFDIENGGRVSQVGDGKLVQIPIETVRRTEVRNSRG